jgi:hypothetical protein
MASRVHTIHVGAVHVDLAAELVDGVADVLDGVLVHAVGGGVRDHQGGQVVLVLLSLGLQLLDVHVTAVVGGDGDNLAKREVRY